MQKNSIRTAFVGSQKVDDLEITASNYFILVR